MSFFNPLLSSLWGSSPRKVPLGTFSDAVAAPVAGRNDSSVFRVVGRFALPRGVALSAEPRVTAHATAK